MLGTSLPMNWSQISEEIPSSLVIMFYKEWDGGEGGREEKGGTSQTSVTVFISWNPNTFLSMSTQILTSVVLITSPLAEYSLPGLDFGHSLVLQTSIANSFQTTPTSSPAHLPHQKGSALDLELSPTACLRSSLSNFLICPCPHHP